MKIYLGDNLLTIDTTQIPKASMDTVGLVKPDEVTTTVNEEGILSANGLEGFDVILDEITGEQNTINETLDEINGEIV